MRETKWKAFSQRRSQMIPTGKRKKKENKREREGGENASMEEQTGFFRKDKHILGEQMGDKFVIMFANSGTRGLSIFIAIKCPPRGNLWEVYSWSPSW